MPIESARIAEQNDRAVFVSLYTASRDEIAGHKGADLWGRTRALTGTASEVFDMASEHQDFICILGTYNDYPFGFLIAEWVAIYDKKSLDIREVFVDSEMRSVGIGEAMMLALFDQAEKFAAFSIVSRALPGDRELKNFFERFKITARIIEVERKL
tara:strand:- start:8323 stop:8790 length:468 start_codon:yes stop_codon:yes gene_type:complete